MLRECEIYRKSLSSRSVGYILSMVSDGNAASPGAGGGGVVGPG